MKKKFTVLLMLFLPGMISAQVNAGIQGNEIQQVAELEGTVLLPGVLLVLLVVVLGGIMVAAQKSKWN